MTEIDERYKKGKIYAIRNITDDTIIYVGSTIHSLTQRFNQHKKDCKRMSHICHMCQCITIGTCYRSPAVQDMPRVMYVCMCECV
jgi:Uri superfamily endonuclease